MSLQKSKSKPKQKAPIKRSSSSNNGPIITDPRFAGIHNDPHFAVPKRKTTKLKVDERFERMLHDDAFSSTAASVDQYGRPISRKEGRKKLARFYDFGNKEEAEEEDESEEEAPRYDPARGEGLVDTSSEDEDEDDLDVDEDEVEQTKQDIDAAANVPVGQVSKRFAVVNLDWDNVRAFHLFKTFSSFSPPGGKVVRVSVYPSEFGKERMEREEVEGPLPEYFGKNKDQKDDEEVIAETIVKEDKGEEDKAALRRWKLDKLRYYYAVVECDTPETASCIYNACDGTEYETTANFFDLRFIPDETSFEDDTPRDECDTMPKTYRANDFVTDALQHSKVTLNWDEDDVQRQQVAKRAFSQKDVEENELKAYLASDTESDDESDKEASKEKYRALLGGMSFGKKGNKEGDMEITFTSALGDNDGGKVIDDDDTAETTIEKYARKEKERKQRRKDKLRAARAEAAGVSVEELAQQNTSTKSKKKPEEPEEPSQVAVDLGFDDPFFDEPVQSIKNAKKEKKKKDREEKAKEEAAQASKRAELELIMADDEEGLGEDGKKLKHFDMKQIVKAQKEKGKKKRKGKKIANGGEEMQEGFEVNVQDPRFQELYGDHRFAIDPTNPKFVKTEGIQKLLEERRKRSQMGEPIEEGGSQKSKKRKTTEKEDDIQKLVQSLKSKNTTKA